MNTTKLAKLLKRLDGNEMSDWSSELAKAREDYETALRCARDGLAKRLRWMGDHISSAYAAQAPLTPRQRALRDALEREFNNY